MIGWIKLHRRILDHPFWKGGRFDRGKAWVDLLLRANHKAGKVMMGGKLITLRRGQVLTSQRQLARDWKWHKETVGVFLKLLKSDEMLAYETAHGAKGGFTLISILNYGRYQDMTESANMDDTVHETAHVTVHAPPTHPSILKNVLRMGRRKEAKKEEGVVGGGGHLPNSEELKDVSLDGDRKTEERRSTMNGERLAAQKRAETIRELLEREGQKTESEFRDWERTQKYFEKVKGVNMAFVRDLWREVFDPVLTLNGGGER